MHLSNSIALTAVATQEARQKLRYHRYFTGLRCLLQLQQAHVVDLAPMRECRNHFE
jgi:hypothetical protein